MAAQRGALADLLLLLLLTLALGPGAVDSGAEWSLFWPGMGMALDSCARLMAALVRPAEAGSAGLMVAGAITVLAGGTEVLTALPACVPGTACAALGITASRKGPGPASGGTFWQPHSKAAMEQTVAAAGDVRMGFLSFSAREC